MIEVFHTTQLIADQVVYRDPRSEESDQQQVERMAGMVLLTRDKREFSKLLESVLLFLTQEAAYQLYAIFVENFTQPKSRIRSYSGLLPGLKKKLEEGVYHEQEFEVGEGQSLFVGLLKVQPTLLSLFLDELVDTRLAFGLLVDPVTSHPLRQPARFLHEVFTETVSLDDPIYVDPLKTLARFIQPGSLMFDIHRDGRDRIHLGLYGCPKTISGSVEPLLDYLRARFYLRSRRQGFQYGAKPVE